MKYDSKKCNNLNFKLASGLSGFIKSAPNGDVYLYQNQNFCNWDPITMTMMPVFWKTVRAEDFDCFVEDSELLIVPRDPETYKDWKVGDKVISNTGNKINTINAMLGKAIVLVRDAEVPITILTSADDLTKYNKLLLTDYEKELIHAQELEEKKKECPFKEGDRVLARNSDTTWRFDVFVKYDKNATYPYECNGSEYEQCIPLNEHTWQLLGTIDEYKATNNNESH
nr:MAG TPA: hypothetical protein [Caudoviricetes sp.]